MHKKI